MGCCCSLFKKKRTRNIKIDETTPLLSKHNDEEVGYEIDNYGTYEEFANNLINIESFDSDGITQREYEERSKFYASRVNNLIFEPIKPTCLLNDIPNPEVILASDPIDPADQRMITVMLEMAVEAMQNFRVDHKEDIIAQFPP